MLQSNILVDHSLFINCGGSNMNFEGNAYEIDNTAGGAFNFFASGQKWAYSSTGAFQHDLKGANYLTQTTDPNVMSIYQTARLAPLSLKYFSLCLLKGSYNVKLHFAKIMFIGDQTFRSSSIGRRIFNVAIQGNEVLKDFEIAAEAGGARKAVTKEFKNVYVNGSTLEILLYWAGKGTTAVPTRSVYGPLISGLTVTPNFKIDSGLSDGAIAGTVVASSFTILVAVLIILRVMGYLGGKGHEDEGKEGQKLHLDWETRKKICFGTAKGLAYLHGESRLKIVHRDIKAMNILLDKELNAKISDFGLAKLDEVENTHSTKIAGTLGVYDS